MARSSSLPRNKWNVTHSEGSARLLVSNVRTKEEALMWAERYRKKYEGRPYPNGMGYYPFTNFRAINVKTRETYPCGS